MSVRRRSSRNSGRVLEARARRRLCSAACRALALRDTAGRHGPGYPAAGHVPARGGQRWQGRAACPESHGGDSRSSPLVQEAVHVLFQPVLYLLLLALLTRRLAPCPGGTT